MKRELAIAVLLACVVPAVWAFGGDWPQWGGTDARNMVSNEKGLPDWFDCGKENAGEVDPATTKNVKWSVKLGATTCGSPVVSGGKVFIGTTAPSTKTAALLCFDEQTGRTLGTYTCNVPKSGKDKVVRCAEAWGVSSTPTIEGHHLYFVSPYQEVLCLDLNVWLGQEPGGATARNAPEAADKGLVWRYDFVKELKAVQEHVSDCSVLIHGDFLYVCTGNGRWRNTDKPIKPYNPLTPSLVVLNKKTGQLVARDDEQIGARLYRGQYSSPSLGTVGKKEQIYFGAGDGVCYAFEPVVASVTVPPGRWVETTQRDPLVQFFDFKASPSGGPRSDAVAATDQPVPQVPGPNVLVEKRFSVGAVPLCSPLNAMPTAKVPDVPLLKKIWWCDCIPDEYKKTPFDGQGAKGDGQGRPCEIIATPVFYRNRVYVAIGADPNHGGPNSKGCLVCIDASKTGDVTKTGVLWKYKEINQSISTVAIGEGLVYALDEACRLHCLDAETGHCYWTDKVMKGTGYHSPVLADGKLFVGGGILAAGQELKVLSSGLPALQFSTPCAANGVLFTVLEKRLWAICDKGDKKPPVVKSAEKAAGMSAEKAAK